VLRVKSDVIITTQKGRKIALRKYPLKPGRTVWFKKISYRLDGHVTDLNLAGVVAPDDDQEGEPSSACAGEPDPWWLLTNLPTPESGIIRYESRFQIEEWFKDLKHRLRISNQQTKCIKRIRRLTLVACISYGLLLLTGKLAKPFKTWYDWLITGREKSASIIWLAIEIIKADLAPGKFWRRVWASALIRAGP